MDHAAAIRLFFDRVNADIDQAIELLAPDFVEHEETSGLSPGREGVRELFSMFLAAFPDMHWAIEDVVVQGDRVAARSRVTGSNDGEFMGMPATGKPINIQAVEFLQFGPDGLIHEHWGVLDMMTLTQQLGAVQEGAV
jgi:steroid delta-isomerase-like uncharacterized protein